MRRTFAHRINYHALTIEQYSFAGPTRREYMRGDQCASSGRCRPENLAKLWKIISCLVLAVVLGPTILALLVPATGRLAWLYLVLGTLQIGIGVTLYLMIVGGGVEWPWMLLIALLGVYHLSRGILLRTAVEQKYRISSRPGPACLNEYQPTSHHKADALGCSEDHNDASGPTPPRKFSAG